MTILQINSAKLYGPWTEGYVLDRHTVSSTPIGPNQWDTVRTPLGQELYNLKYGRSKSIVNIVDTCEAFINSVRWTGEIGLVVLAPPTRARAFQPVFSVASELAARLKIAVETGALTTTVTTSQAASNRDRYSIAIPRASRRHQPRAPQRSHRKQPPTGCATHHPQSPARVGVRRA